MVKPVGSASSSVSVQSSSQQAKSAPAIKAKDSMSTASTKPEQGFFTTIVDLISSLLSLLTCGLIGSKSNPAQVAKKFLAILKANNTSPEVVAGIVAKFIQSLSAEDQKKAHLAIASKIWIKRPFSSEDKRIASAMADEMKGGKSSRAYVTEEMQKLI